MTGNEHELAEFMASKLDNAELQTENNLVNVVAKKVMDPTKPTIILNGHLDTVPVMRNWQRNPFKPVIEDGKLFGLGASDMKAGLAILVDVYKKIKIDNVNLVLVLSSDEEDESHGSYRFLKKIETPSDICLIAEPSNERIMLGARGRYEVVLEVFGRSAHGARPTLGINAIADATEIVRRLKNLTIRSHKKLGKGSVYVLKIEGVGESLSVPDYCRVWVDRQVVFGETQELIKRDFEQFLKTLDIKSKIEISWAERKTPFLEPYLVDRNNKYVQKFLAAYQNFYVKVQKSFLQGR